MSKNENLKPYIELLTFLTLSDGFTTERDCVIEMYFSQPAAGMNKFKNVDELELAESKINLILSNEDFYAGRKVYDFEIAEK